MRNPRVDVEKAQNEGCSPFFIACQEGRMEVVSLLLADPRIDANKPMNNQGTPLWFASQNGHLVVVQLLLASEKEIDTRRRSTFNNKTAAEQGRATGMRTTKEAGETEEIFQRKKTNGPLCADLIDAYEKDPAKVITQLRKRLGLKGIYFLFA